jgi:N6-adenosine-specific RNA methylase IME4
MRFPIIYADPAWTYDDKALAGNRGAGCKYSLMTELEMQRLPVPSISAEDSVCFMWATYPKLAEGLELLAAWGFTYKTVAFTWVKTNGPDARTPYFIGMGRWTRSNAEIVLLGVRGKPQRVDAGVNQIIAAPRGRHSAKPTETRDRIVRLCGDLPRVELFARDSCPGWTSLGYDIDGRDLRESIPALAKLPPRR